MKKRLLLVGLFLSLWIAYQSITPAGMVHSSSAGAPAGRTGSPGDGSNCTGCHSGTAINQTGWITSNIPASGYTPGQTYQITGTATSSGRTKFGFQISPQNPSGQLLGTMASTSANTQLTGSNKYMTHTAAGNQGGNGSHTWTFNWTAPAAGTGDVTFYGAFNATNNSSTTAGDIIYLSTLAVQENVTSGIIEKTATSDFSVFPNPITDGTIRMNLNKTLNGMTTVQVYSLSGTLIQSETLTGIQAGSTHSIQLPAGIPQGLYLMNLVSEDATSVQKILVK
jgi:hypothetical protein